MRTLAALSCAALLFAAPAFSQQLAATPPMGWNSWNHFAEHVTDADVRSAADMIVSTGMRDAGYIYVNLDDTWQGTRDAQGILHPNDRFPDMKALADYVHSKGLKFGIYSGPGAKTCGGYAGSLGHEEQDAKMYASWGVDFLKYDLCSFQQNMNEAKAAHPGAQMWRTTDDIDDSYGRMVMIGFSQAGLSKYAGPGRWNDPDMLEVGNGKMTTDEYKTHMSLWVILAAPLLAGNDLSKMTDTDKSILMNKEAVAIDQDPLGKQGDRLYQSGDFDVWTKPLSNGRVAVGLFNRSWDNHEVSVDLSEIGFKNGANLRDVWKQQDLGRHTGFFTDVIPKHGVTLLIVSE
jgi:alpha-galactosidase